jgi:hypothetical protein
MNRIRALRREDMPEVAALFELVARSGSRTPPRRLAAHLEGLFLDHPWVDAEIPSLVSVDDGEGVVGFLGSHVRRMRFDGRPIRLASSGQLVTEPRVRRQAAGAFLMQKYLAGPQDLTVTDTASETVRRIWEGFGGETAHLGRIGWIKLFRPCGFGAEWLLRNHALWRQVASSITPAVDGMLERLGSRYLKVDRSDADAEQLTPTTMIGHLPVVTGALRLYPDYDAGFLEWLFRQLELVRSRGKPAGFLLRDRKGKVLGWYLYYLRRGGISRVLQIAGRERDLEAVLDHLFEHAQENGSTALQGRLEPSLVESLSRRHCIFHASGHRVLVHSKIPELLHSIYSGRALLTRLEGDWWMGPHLEPFS